MALGIALAGATREENVESRLEIFDSIRRNRASAIQMLSNAGVDQTDLIAEELAKYTDTIPSKASTFPRS